jgi:membrane peptidoglycan carboxypeptidase
VKVLYLAGISDSIKTAVDMGITTLADAGRYGLTLVLGGGEVRLLDMVSAYGVFAAEGIRHPAQAILRVEDKDGNVLEEKSERPVRALDTNIARLVTDILSDNEARTPLYGSNSPLYFGGVDVAAKTGTTNDYKDAWIVGYTPKLAVGAWAGNNIPESMNQISGLIVTPMWRAFMDYALVKYPGGSFTPPDPTPEDVPPILRGVWTPIAGGEVHSILYWIDPDNPRGGPPRNPSRDSQFYSWEYGVSAWALSHGYGSFFLPLPQQTPVFPLLPPTQPTQQTSVSSPSFVITAPVDGTSLNRGDVLSISVLADSSVRYVSYYINNAFIGTSDKPPFSFSYVPTEGGFLTIKASSDTGLSNEVVLFVN